MAGDQTAQGYGQFGPEDSSSDFNVTDFHIRQKLGQLHTNKVVKVIAVYDAQGKAVDAKDTGVLGATGFVDVQIMVNMMDGVGNAQEHGIIHNVPFARTQGGANGVIMDPKVGDIGIMACSDRDISSVKANRDVANPGSWRQMSPADGMYVGGLLNGEPSQYLRFLDEGLQLVDIKGNKILFSPDGIQVEDTNGNKVNLTDSGVSIVDLNGNEITTTSGEIKLKASTIKVEGALEVTGGATFGGNVTAQSGVSGQVDLLHHVHPQGNDSHGDVEQDTGPPIGAP